MKTDTKFNILFTITYAIFTLILVMHHEIWADEAQVWLLAKNLSVFGLFKHLVNEGHPSFFYLLMMPFAKMGFSALIMQIVCWLSMVISVFLLLEYSPFNKLAKFGIITSAGFLYFLPVIARSYSIIPLMVFALAIMYPKAKEHPYCYTLLLACLANTHVIMFAFVFILGLYFVADNCLQNGEKFCLKNIFLNGNFKKLMPVWIIVGGLFAVVLQLYQTAGSNGAINYSTENFLKTITRVFVQFFANSVDYFTSIQLSLKIMPDYIVFYFAAAFLLFILFVILLFLPLFYKNHLSKKVFWLGFLSIGFQLGIYLFAYSAIIYPSRTFISFSILIFCYWILLANKEENFNSEFVNYNKVNIVIALFFFLTMFSGLCFGLKDYKYTYSGAEKTSQFIRNNIEKDSIIIPTGEAFGLAVYYYLPDYDFYSIFRHEKIQYMVWYERDLNSEINADILFTQLLEEEIEKYNLSGKKIYILSDSFLNLHNFSQTLPQKYKLLYTSPSSYAIGEKFQVYEYKSEKLLKKDSI